MSGSQTQNVEIVLTFDDGPHHAENNNRTRKVLDVLKNTNTITPGIRAVFFIQSDALDDNNNPMRGKHMTYSPC